MTIDRHQPAPLYAQIQRDIEISIATNKLRPGDIVPGEIDLANRYGVSRVTVRQALGELVTEGLLYRMQGRGTFVAQPMIQRMEPHITSFFYEMRQVGKKVTATSSSEVCRPDPESARLLRLTPSELVIVTRRLRYVDGEPIVYQVNVTRESLCRGLATEDFAAQSFQYTLETKYGVRIVEVEISLKSIAPDEELARLLDIPLDVPVLVDCRMMYGVGGVVIGSARACFRGDRYSFKVTRRLSMPCAGN